MQSVTQELFPLFQQILLRSSMRDVQLELLNHDIKFPGQIESVGENEASRFYSVLTLWPPGQVKVSESGIEW